MSLTVRGLVKRYAGNTVLAGVDLEVKDGEVHALLGANGAGKSTLIKCVAGAEPWDDGDIELDGSSLMGNTPKDALKAGVGIVHQHLSVVDSLSAADNIFLGDEVTRGPFLRRKSTGRQAAEWLGRLGADFDASTRASSLGVAERQVVEIAKALRREPAVLILDEPTAALTEVEAERLGEQVKRLRAQRVAVMYVTHRLDEVFELADRVTVLSGGRVAVSAPVAEVDKSQLVSAIAGGRAIPAQGPRGRNGAGPREGTAIAVRGLRGPGLGPLELAVREGEILGVFGLVGSGRTELLETMFGARRALGGEIEVGGRSVRLRHPADAVAAGVALVPSDRLRNGLLATLDAQTNVVLAGLRRMSAGRVWRRRGRERGAFAALAEKLALQPNRPELEAGRYSGGNQQKLVLGRWLTAGQRFAVLLLDEPTQGVDVSARGDLYAGLRELVQDGCAAIVTSSEPEELVELADRIVVLARGRVVAEVSAAEATETGLLELAHLGEPGGS